MKNGTLRETPKCTVICLLISSKLLVLLSLLLSRTSHKVDKKTSFPEMHKNIENFSLLVQKKKRIYSLSSIHSLQLLFTFSPLIRIHVLSFLLLLSRLA